MELKEIQISNFRSIKSMKIPVQEVDGKRCLILLGKNEAGKSNILKAISAVFGKSKVSAKDQRKEQGDESIPNDHYYVRAVFELSQEDIQKVYDEFLNQYSGVEFIEFQKDLNLKDFIQEVFQSVVLRIGISEGKSPEMRYWEYNQDDYKIKRKIFLQDNEFCEVKNGEQEFTVLDLGGCLFSIIKNNWDLLSLYRCEQWRYTSDFILPKDVNIQTFQQNPNSCIPLKKLFMLAEKPDITEAINKAYNQDEGLHNLLDNISKASTKAFQEAWKDLGKVEFSLTPNGNNIDIFIKDELKFKMKERSDGFKHFVSMLLALSLDDEEQCEKIFLIDEPDTHLYPTSAKSLRNELLKIAEKNLVIYSTHSQYMIDNMALNENLRHLIIEKKDGITSIFESQSKSNYTEDELLLRAIGCSIFERIKDKNIIFEGYNDYKLFDKNKKSKQFKNYGVIYITGIGDVKNIIPMVMLAGAKFCIVSDSDNASKDQRKKFKEDFPDCVDFWLEYDECEKDYQTLEDFYRPDFITKIIQEEYADFSFDSKKTAIQNIEDYIKSKNYPKEECRKKIRSIKNQLVEKSNPQDLQGYSTFLKNLADKMKNL